MIISQEVQNMCPVAQGVHHGAAPIPEEAKWVKAKEAKNTLLNVEIELNPDLMAISGKG